LHGAVQGGNGYI